MYFILCSNGPVSRHNRDMAFFCPIAIFFLFANVHMKVLSSVVHNWHTYFMTKEAEEFKVVFPNLASVSEETHFQSNSGQIQLPPTMMPMDVLQ